MNRVAGGFTGAAGQVSPVKNIYGETEALDSRSGSFPNFSRRATPSGMRARSSVRAMGVNPTSPRPQLSLATWADR